MVTKRKTDEELTRNRRGFKPPNTKKAIAQVRKAVLKDCQPSDKDWEVPIGSDGHPNMYIDVFTQLVRRRRDPETKQYPAYPETYRPAKGIDPSQQRRTSGPICGMPRSNRSTSGTGYCCNPAGMGTQHPGMGPCKFHGGSNPNNERHYARKQLDLELGVYGSPIATDPHTAVMDEIHRSAGIVAWLDKKLKEVAELEGDESLTQLTAAGRKASVWVAMYQEERDRLVNHCKAAVSMGVAERNVRLAEEQGRMIAMVIQGFLNDRDLNLTPQQMHLAPKLIRKHMSSIVALGPAPTEPSEDPLAGVDLTSPPVEVHSHT